VPVSVIVGSIAEGFTPERVIESWPQLTVEDIKAALKFAAEGSQWRRPCVAAWRQRVMAARLKIDEDLPQEIAELLNAHGYDAVTVREQGWTGSADGDLWQRIQKEDRWLVTADKGFADVRLYPPGTHAGLRLLRANEEGLEDDLRLAVKAVERLPFEELSGAVVVISDRGVRIRRAP
jgi:predicted nuclease of predicted toxin-antitoxin system